PRSSAAARRRSPGEPGSAARRQGGARVPTLADLLSRDRLLLDLRVGSKRELFQELAAVVEAATGIDQTVALAALVQREKLGTTGIGDGLALPHARLPGLARPLAPFARLARPVDCDPLPEPPVDLVLALVAPGAS